MTENGKRLAAWRVLNGLSQAAAAAKIGVTQPAWASWEVGRGSPDAENRPKVEALTDGKVPASAWPPRRHAQKQVRRAVPRPPESATNAKDPTGTDDAE